MFTNYNIYFAAFTVAISGLLFGYDTGIISGAILFIKQSFAISDKEIGMIVSAVPLGALISAVLVGKLSDWIGRKKILMFTALFFIFGSVICAVALGVKTLVIGRLILGIAIGMSSVCAPLYIAEISDEKNRGALVTLYLIAVNAGIFFSYLVNYVFSTTGAWRLVLLLGALPAVILGICIMILPESPRWLMMKGRSIDAFKVLVRIHGEVKAHLEMLEIKKVIMQEKTFISKLFQDNYLRIILLGIVISILTQAVGINAIIYYAPTIFQTTGFSELTVSILATMGLGLTVTLAAILAALLIDKVGRRKLILTGLTGIILSLVLIVGAFYYVHDQYFLGWLVFIGMILFVACQGLSVGPACFLLPSEIFPVKIRGTAMGISIAFNWLTNAVIAFLFPISLSQYGATFSFSVFLVISIMAWILFYLYLPETKNISLERLELNLLDGVKTRYLGDKQHA